MWQMYVDISEDCTAYSFSIEEFILRFLDLLLAMMIQALPSSEIPLYFYQITRLHITEDSIIFKVRFCF
jgi:hypothetical protein